MSRAQIGRYASCASIGATIEVGAMLCFRMCLEAAWQLGSFQTGPTGVEGEQLASWLDKITLP